MRGIDRARRRGFTLVEMIVMIMIVGIGLTGVMITINQANRESAVPFIRKQAIAIAESIMEEVTARSFAVQGDPVATKVTIGGTALQRRNATHDVADYNGFAMSGIRAPDDDTTVLSGLADYSVSVTVTPTAFGAITMANSKLVSVTVSGPNGVQVILEGFKLNYSGT